MTNTSERDNERNREDGDRPGRHEEKRGKADAAARDKQTGSPAKSDNDQAGGKPRNLGNKGSKGSQGGNQGSRGGDSSGNNNGANG